MYLRNTVPYLNLFGTQLKTAQADLTCELCRCRKACIGEEHHMDVPLQISQSVHCIDCIIEDGMDLRL